MKGEIRMVDIEGAILYGDANKGVVDIIEMFVNCQIWRGVFIILALIIFDGNKSTPFEDVNNCFPYTDLVSKMVRYYSSFFLGTYKLELSEFGDKFYFV